jgi:hypothetical protein
MRRPAVGQQQVLASGRFVALNLTFRQTYADEQQAWSK